MPIYENEQPVEKAVLIGIDTGDYDAETSIDELEELAKTAGAEVLFKIIQKKDRPDAALYFGKGKLAELAALCKAYDANEIIADSELSPSQQRNLESVTGMKVIDRTTLILDIFASRARSAEGKIQVELAQLRYLLPRLSGRGKEMSRLGGGIGTRGPGETKLETDKRHINRKISHLESELELLQQRRQRLRERRSKDGVTSVAIVGYTNAGKSTLMNYLTNSNVLAQDMLFATLDPTARALTLPSGRKIMLIDTVGLIRRLPHKLVEAFKSTLEEAANASLILNVCDASDKHAAEHMKVTKSLLDELGASDKPIISVMNKCDLAKDLYDMPTFGSVVHISALDGNGVDNLLNTIDRLLPQTSKRVKLLIPFKYTSYSAKIRQEGQVYFEEYTPDGLIMDALVDCKLLDEIKEWIID